MHRTGPITHTKILFDSTQLLRKIVLSQYPNNLLIWPLLVTAFSVLDKIGKKGLQFLVLGLPKFSTIFLFCHQYLHFQTAHSSTLQEEKETMGLGLGSALSWLCHHQPIAQPLHSSPSSPHLETMGTGCVKPWVTMVGGLLACPLAERGDRGQKGNPRKADLGSVCNGEPEL